MKFLREIIEKAGRVLKIAGFIHFLDCCSVNIFKMKLNLNL